MRSSEHHSWKWDVAGHSPCGPRTTPASNWEFFLGLKSRSCVDLPRSQATVFRPIYG